MNKSIKKNIMFSTIASFAFLAIVNFYNACSPVGVAIDSTSLSSTGGSGGNSTNTPGTSTPAPKKLFATPGETYFKNVMIPLFNQENQCLKCHGSPREVIRLGGFLAPTITANYQSMRALLLSANGTSTNNNFLNKTLSLLNHAGGNMCSIFGIVESPCKEVVEWYQTESNSNSTIPGTISKIDGLGFIRGWAADFNDPTISVDVNLYINGPSGVGTLLSKVTANKPGSAGGIPGMHGYEFQLPNIYRDKLPHEVYAYGIDAQGTEVPLGVPYTATAYQMSAAGLAFYNNNVAGIVNSCNSCHGFSRDDAFTRILLPLPNDGGSANNNSFVIYGTGGNGHGGGAACGANCQAVRDWWNIEFAP